MSVEVLLNRISEFQEHISRGLVSDGYFQKNYLALLSSAADLRIWIRTELSDANGKALCSYEAVAEPQGADADSRNRSERAARLLTRHARCSPCELAADTVDDLVRRLGDLALSHWSARDEGTLLPRLLDAGMPDRVLHSLRDLIQDVKYLAVVHADLDKFKRVNDQFGEAVGNIVIREFADRLRHSFADLGVVVRTGGEEFSAFLVANDPVLFFERVETFRRLMETEPLLGIERTNTCSIGLAIYEARELPTTIGRVDDVLEDARKAERRAKNEGRNRIRLPKPEAVVGETAGPSDTHADMKWAALASRSDLDGDDAVAFQSPFARAVARLLTQRFGDPELNRASIGDIVANCAESLDVTPVALPPNGHEKDGAPARSEWPLPVLPNMPTRVWAAIVARALLSASFRNGGPLAVGDQLILRSTPDEQTSGETLRTSSLWLDVLDTTGTPASIRLGPIAEGAPATVRIGRPWFPDDRNGNEGLRRLRIERENDGFDRREILSPCLLLPIGDAASHEAKAIGNLVAESIELDDRPVKGGGLPDFWQSNLARVVRVCLRNPNISKIIAIGEEEGASQTISMLKLSQTEWIEKLPDLQRRLSIGADHLGTFGKRGIQFQLVPRGSSHLLDAVVACTASDDIGDTQGKPAIDLGLAIDRRRIPIPAATTSNQLSISDGLRSRTLADAYPLAIQLLRGSNEPPQREANRRDFREFPCFKLVLTHPFHDEVPDYWRTERAAFDAYVERNFNSPDGLFGQRINKSEDPSDTIREHGVIASVSAIKERRPTRRIALPVATSSELDQPLGLSMIQILPRQREGKWHLDFQWIWRTVEVLVGFPFSAIGSIRWSQNFFESVEERLIAEGYHDQIEIGQLTYVALSFHMFLDVGDQEIARAIVQDATR